jgi:hypothetical protein
MQAMAQAEVGEADAEQRDDWGWEVVYSRRGSQYGDMLSFQLAFDLPWQKGRRQQPQIAARQKDIQRIEAERDDTIRRHLETVEDDLAPSRRSTRNARACNSAAWHWPTNASRSPWPATRAVAATWPP